MTSRPTRQRKSIRPNLNENALIIAGSQGSDTHTDTTSTSSIDEDAAEEYRVPVPRKSKSSQESKEDVEMADGDSEEEKKAPKPRGRKKAAAAAVVDESDAGGDEGEASAAPKKRGAKAQRAADLLVDKAELLSPLYQALANSQTATLALATELITQYRNPKKVERARLGLINFILATCGSTHVVQSEDLDLDAMQIVREASSVDQQSSIAPPYVRLIATLPERWTDFWQKFTQLAFEQEEALFDDLLFPSIIIPWLQAGAMSHVRVWRLTCVEAAFAIITRLNEICIELLKRIDVVEQQSKDTSLKKSTLKDLKEELAKLNEQIDSIQILLKNIFSIYVHRFRDVDINIRLVCIESLGRWVLEYPGYWLNDSNIKYIGWALSDKDPNVRASALRTSLTLIRSENKFILSKLTLFKQRFKARFLTLVLDLNPEVAGLGIEFLVELLKLDELSAEECDNVPILLWDESIELREAATAFVMEDTFKSDDDGERGRMTKEKKDFEDIGFFINLLDKYYPADKLNAADRQRVVADGKFLHGVDSGFQPPMDRLLNNFWDHLPVLREYETFTKLMIKAAHPTSQKGVGGRKVAIPVDEDRQTMYCHLLYSIAKRATGRMEDAPNLTNVTKKGEREAIFAEGQRFSSHFITVAVELLTMYQTDAPKLQVLLSILPMIDLTLFGVLRKDAEFTALLKRLKTIYLKNTDERVLEQTAVIYRFMIDTEHQFKDDAFESATTLATELSEEYHLCYERIHGSQMDIEMESAERLTTMASTLRRMNCLQRSLALPQLSWESIPELHKAFEFYALNHAEEVEQEILIQLMHLGYTNLAWNFEKLQAETHVGEEAEEEGEEEEEEEKKGEDEDVEMEEEEKKSSSKKKKKPAKGSSKKKKSASAKKKRESAGAAAAKKVTKKLLDTTQRISKEYLSVLHNAYGSTEASAFLVKDVIYKILSDCFVLFSGKLVGTPLEPLAISQQKLDELSPSFNEYFTILIDGKDFKHRFDRSFTEKQKASYKLDQQLSAIKDAIRVVAFDMNSSQEVKRMRTTIRHRELAGLLLARVGTLGDEIDGLLKEFMKVLNRISTNTLLQCQLEAIEYCFEHKTRDEESFKLMVEKSFVGPFFTAFHAEKRSLVGIVRHGLIHAFAHDVPKTLPFIQYLLPYIKHMSRKDVAETIKIFVQVGTRCLEGVEPEDRQEEEWEMFQVLADAINKKWQKPIVAIHDRAVAIVTGKEKGGVAPPATPARGKKGEELITGALTPMGSPGLNVSRARATPPSSKSVAGGRRSARASETPLAAVEESMDESEEGGATAKPKRQSTSTTAGKKRGRRAVQAEEEEEEEEEEEAEPEEEEEQPEEEEEEQEEEDENAMEVDEEEEEAEAPKPSKKGGKKAAAPIEAEPPRRGRKRAAE